MPLYGFDEGKNKNEIDLDAKQNKHSTVSGTLIANSWISDVGGYYTQTISVDGVTTTNTIIVSAAPASVEEYGACGIFASDPEENGTVKFWCKKTPLNNISVRFLILGV